MRGLTYDNYISNVNATVGNFTTSFTISVWARSTQTVASSRYPVFIGKGQWSQTARWHIGINGDDSSHFFARASPGNVLDGGVNDGNWHHHVLTHVPSGSDLYYIDGTQVATTAGSATQISNTDAIMMGNNPAYFALSKLEGDIAEPAFWNYNLSSQQVLNLTAGTYPAGTVARWSFTNHPATVWNMASATNKRGNIDASYTFGGGEMYVTNGVAKFDGVQTYGVVYDPIALPSTNFTISLWTYTTNTFSSASNKLEYLLSWATVTTNRTQFGINRANTASNAKTNSFFIWGGDGVAHDDSGGFTCFDDSHVTNWNNLVVTYNTNADPKCVFYLNGVQLATNRNLFVAPPDHNKLFIGQRADSLPNAIYAFEGCMDDVKIWGRTLTSNEVNQNYIGGKL